MGIPCRAVQEIPSINFRHVSLVDSPLRADTKYFFHPTGAGGDFVRLTQVVTLHGERASVSCGWRERLEVAAD